MQAHAIPVEDVEVVDHHRGRCRQPRGQRRRGGGQSPLCPGMRAGGGGEGEKGGGGGEYCDNALRAAGSDVF